MALTTSEIEQYHAELVDITEAYLRPVLHLEATDFSLAEDRDKKRLEVGINRLPDDVDLSEAGFSYSVTEFCGQDPRTGGQLWFGHNYESTPTTFTRKLYVVTMIGRSWVSQCVDARNSSLRSVPWEETNELRRYRAQMLDGVTIGCDLNLLRGAFLGKTILDGVSGRPVI